MPSETRGEVSSDYLSLCMHVTYNTDATYPVTTTPNPLALSQPPPFTPPTLLPSPFHMALRICCNAGAKGGGEASFVAPEMVPSSTAKPNFFSLGLSVAWNRGRLSAPLALSPEADLIDACWTGPARNGRIQDTLSAATGDG
ncbi:hypothetical protein TcWFU_005335 [Taenia crassiceps]|uniref:Uncharacterized protein n=1 Tax=Taenia crassiceps TaxID=6207 RepID=A0ABR4Q4D0_9CEST